MSRGGAVIVLAKVTANRGNDMSEVTELGVVLRGPPLSLWGQNWQLFVPPGV